LLEAGTAENSPDVRVNLDTDQVSWELVPKGRLRVAQGASPGSR
jgi:hypothetical protein